MAMDIELGALLADASQAAAYFIDVRDRALVVEAASALDFTVATANLGNVTDRDALLEELVAALGAPVTAGVDWDTLAEGLGDLSWLPAPGHVLLLDHCAALREAASDDFATLLEILDAAARAHAAAGVPFWSVLPVASPDA